MFEVRHVSALFDTGYGRAVLAKALLVGGLVALGAVNRRRLVPALAYAARRTPSRRALAALRRNVRVEVALIAAALAVTALLVSFAPPADRGAVGRARRRAGWRAAPRSATRRSATRSTPRASG